MWSSMTVGLAWIFPIALMLARVSTPEIATDAGVRAMFRQMLSQTRYGFSREEAAAFVVRDGNGHLAVVAWPDADGIPDCAHWYGRFPEGVVAIVHTHPNWLPEPSTIDAQTARVTGVPVYVITAGRVSKTNGGRSQVVLDHGWSRSPD
jgi:hypothetical protein